MFLLSYDMSQKLKLLGNSPTIHIKPFNTSLTCKCKYSNKLETKYEGEKHNANEEQMQMERLESKTSPIMIDNIALASGANNVKKAMQPSRFKLFFIGL